MIIAKREMPGELHAHFPGKINGTLFSQIFAGQNFLKFSQIFTNFLIVISGWVTENVISLVPFGQIEWFKYQNRTSELPVPF